MLSASLGPPLKKEKKRKKDLCSREDQDLTTNAFTLWKHDYTMLLCARREINYSCNTQIFFFSVPPCSCKRLGIIPGWNQHDEETIIIIGLLKLHSLLPLEAVEYSNHSQINRKKTLAGGERRREEHLLFTEGQQTSGYRHWKSTVFSCRKIGLRAQRKWRERNKKNPEWLYNTVH